MVKARLSLVRQGLSLAAQTTQGIYGEDGGKPTEMREISPEKQPPRPAETALTASKMSPCSGRTGDVLRMEVSYGEGPATNTGPESCASAAVRPRVKH